MKPLTGLGATKRAEGREDVSATSLHGHPQCPIGRRIQSPLLLRCEGRGGAALAVSRSPAGASWVEQRVELRVPTDNGPRLDVALLVPTDGDLSAEGPRM
ncbi:unnamed protein product [Boreogadus saida]